MSLEKLKNLKFKFRQQPCETQQKIAEILHKIHLGVAEKSDHDWLQNVLSFHSSALSGEQAAHLTDYFLNQDEAPAFAWQGFAAVLAHEPADWHHAETDPDLPRYSEDDVATIADVKKPLA